MREGEEITPRSAIVTPKKRMARARNLLEKFTHAETSERKFIINFKNTPFIQTSKTGTATNRLNWRCDILLTRNQEAIKGKRILDLASHDGRFSHACLELGATYVVGVEGRQHLVEFARENLTGLGHKPNQFHFVLDDVFNYLPKVKPKGFDTILCFGFFYHMIRQIELLRELKRIQPKYILLDSKIASGIFLRTGVRVKLRSTIKYIFFILALTIFKKMEETIERVKGMPCLIFGHESHIIEGATIDEIDLVAWPTKNLIELLFKRHGFRIKQLIWNKREIQDWTAIKDYKNGDRVSYIAQRL